MIKKYAFFPTGFAGLGCMFLCFALMMTKACILLGSDTRIVRVLVSADSDNENHEAFRAMDGDTETMWHSQFNKPSGNGPLSRNPLFWQPHPFTCNYHYACGHDHPKPPSSRTEPVSSWTTIRLGNGAPHPHELRIDLGDRYVIEGFIYTARSDGQTNGTIARYQFYGVDDIEDFNGAVTPLIEGTFEEKQKVHEIRLPKPVRCRFLKLVALSEFRGKPYASVAEFVPLVEGVRFLAMQSLPPGAKQIQRQADAANDPRLQERVNEWNLLAERFKAPLYWKAIEQEVYDKASLILPGDRDPVDVALRRVAALYDNWETDASALKKRSWKTTLDDLRVKNSAVPAGNPEKRFQLFQEVAALRREMLFEAAGYRMRNENGKTDELLFVKRHRSTYPHMCDQFYGRTQRPGGGLYALSVSGNPEFSVRVRNLLENRLVESGRLKGQKLEGGSFLSPDVSFDGEKIAFAYVECSGSPDHEEHLDVTRGHWDRGRCFHIFTCNKDGSELRQITDGTWNDFDPCWLPNGRIAFVSERRNGYLRCGRECPTYTLYDMNPDGSKMRCLSFHETNEWNPSVTHDGKILYTRWDYVDRYGCIVHHPWVTTLDGRDPRQVHGNYSHRHRRADAEFDCRAVPGSPKYMATGGPHHGQSFGSLVLVDPQAEDDDAMGPVKRITPDVGFPESQGGGQVYGTPWPFSEKLFLCVADFSYQPGGKVPGVPNDRKGSYGRGNDGIYIADVYGNRELLYRDPEIASISPMPLAARPTPHALPDLVDGESIDHQPHVGLRDRATQGTGTMLLVNVYDSLRPFPEGTKIKELRIIQLLPMSVPSGKPPHQTGIKEASSLDSVNIARCVLGTVPVEEDGSAYFELPARIEFQFQAIDTSGLAVQSMRSSSYVQPGENLSCNGCHEPKTNAPSRRTVIPKAFLREPSRIRVETAPGARPFSYPLLVQPILDAHCAECHAKPESKTFSLAREPVTNKFYASYNNLAKRYGFTDYGDSLRTTPGKFGARAAPLYELLRAGHYDVRLSEEEMHRIVLWLDCLSNFYGVYEKEGGEAQLRGEIAWPTLE